jgi:hypothetical protein
MCRPGSEAAYENPYMQAAYENPADCADGELMLENVAVG